MPDPWAVVDRRVCGVSASLPRPATHRDIATDYEKYRVRTSKNDKRFTEEMLTRFTLSPSGVLIIQSRSLTLTFIINRIRSRVLSNRVLILIRFLFSSENKESIHEKTKAEKLKMHSKTLYNGRKDQKINLTIPGKLASS